MQNAANSAQLEIILENRKFSLIQLVHPGNNRHAGQEQTCIGSERAHACHSDARVEPNTIY